MSLFSVLGHVDKSLQLKRVAACLKRTVACVSHKIFTKYAAVRLNLWPHAAACFKHKSEVSDTQAHVYIT